MQKSTVARSASITSEVSGGRPGAQSGVGHVLEFVSPDTARGLHGDAVTQGGDVPGDERRVGLRGQVTVVDGPLEPGPDGGVAVVTPRDEEVAGFRTGVTGGQGTLDAQAPV